MKININKIALCATLLGVASIQQTSASISIVSQTLLPPTGVTFINLGAADGQTTHTILGLAQIDATSAAPSGEGFVSGSNTLYAPPTVDAASDPYVGTYISTGTGTVTFSFAAPQSFFGLLWGSVDASNSITFSGGSGASQTFLGSALSGPATHNGSQTFGGTEYVELSDVGSTFQTVTLTSGQISFEAAEFSNNAPTPEPAFYGLVGSGLAILGTVLTRRRRNSSSSSK